ncbi:ATP-binding protein [Streptomyces sp. NPDC059679]|uniref:ATP-binding protein n=1 Tax=Streptomyces sp. NPDC059679 TaxID=3346903 RepID=UPI0036A26864
MPVVYVTVPPRATPKMLAIEFARFLGLPVPRTETQTSITNAVCDLLIKLRVELALVDEIHNLNLATQAGAEASDQLKYLSERIPATFVLAGRRGQRPVQRSPRAADRRPLHRHRHRTVRLRHQRTTTGLAEPGRLTRRRAQAAPAQARKPGQARRLPPRTHRRRDRQSLPIGPRRGP